MTKKEIARLAYVERRLAEVERRMPVYLPVVFAPPQAPRPLWEPAFPNLPISICGTAQHGSVYSCN